MEFIKQNGARIAILTAAALGAAALAGSRGTIVKILGTAAAMGAGLYVTTKIS